MEGAAKQVEKEIREAYIFLREKNMKIPSETLKFMLDASLEKLEKVKLVSNIKQGSLDWYLKEFTPHENFMSQIMSEEGRNDIVKLYKKHLQLNKGISFSDNYGTAGYLPKDLEV